MKTVLSSLLLLILSFQVQAAEKPTSAKAYSIKVKLTGLKDTVCYLAYHFGDKQYLKDTAKVDSKGNMVFDGKDKLLSGIYLVVLPSKTNFEFLVPDNQQTFSLETDTSKMIEHMKVTGSKENETFYTFLQFLGKKTKQADPLVDGYKKTKDKNKDSATIFQNKLTEIEKEVKAQRAKVIAENPNTLVAKIFKASTDLEIPETPTLPNGKKDSTFAYRWMKVHYFDNIDFADDRFLRTPLLHSKIKYYLENLTPQSPDSINKSADFIVEKARANKEVFKYVVWNITNTYETSNIMGMDAIFVHMAEKYYLSGQAFWIDSTVKSKINERYTTLKPLLLGKKAPALSLPDSSNNFHSLYEQKGKFTVLYFWDPNCGHCQKETPRLNDFFNDPKNKNVSIYAVSTDHPNDWKKFIREKGLKFLNVCNAISDKTVYYDVRKGYDVYSTPTIYVLNDKKEIVAKRLGVEQLGEFIEGYTKMMEEKEKKKAN
ncbi:MAG: redoxin domain-containing protein [Opitutaceae bacterium]|nr:redoxin domain-containing protein [Cytophagales bacterium]